VTKRRRVVAYITRERDGRRELLVFEHEDFPHLGLQVPAGRLEAGEEVEAGLLRELEEEAGLTAIRSVRELPGFEGHYSSRYENHGYHVVLEDDAPNEWEHVVSGDGDDAGLAFRYRWVPIGSDLQLFARPHPRIRELDAPPE
jgi:8-oxo-dGTP pyrophosphatase MutT (NUDIX family)